MVETVSVAGLFAEAIDTVRQVVGKRSGKCPTHDQGRKFRIRYRANFALSTACLEVIEHVPDPAAVVDACTRLTRPGGDLFFATLNRTPVAYLLAIVMAERVLRIVPAGTHQYARFIRPQELRTWARHAGLDQGKFAGMLYLPYLRRAKIITNLAVNYLAHFKRA